MAQVFYSKIQLARELKIDPRKLSRIPLVPAVSDASNKPLYDLQSARKQWDAYVAGEKAQGTRTMSNEKRRA